MWWATFSYQTSYVGSELYPSEMLDNQLHELGHQLGKQTGIAPDLASPKSETLARDLQDCYAQGNKK